jgi:hypothetical protein
VTKKAENKHIGSQFRDGSEAEVMVSGMTVNGSVDFSGKGLCYFLRFTLTGS